MIFHLDVKFEANHTRFKVTPLPRIILFHDITKLTAEHEKGLINLPQV